MFGGNNPGAWDKLHPCQALGRRIFEACVEQARQEGIEDFECFSSLNAEVGLLPENRVATQVHQDAPSSPLPGFSV